MKRLQYYKGEAGGHRQSLIFGAAAAASILLALMPLISSAEPSAADDNSSLVAIPEVCRLTADSTETQRRACLEKEWGDYLVLQKQLDDPRIQKFKETVQKINDTLRKVHDEAEAMLKSRQITREQFDQLEMELRIEALAARLELGSDGEPGGCANPAHGTSWLSYLVKDKHDPITDRRLAILFSEQSLAACFAGVAKNPSATTEMVRMAKEGEAISLQVASQAQERSCRAYLQNPFDSEWHETFEGVSRTLEIENCMLTFNPELKGRNGVSPRIDYLDPA